MARFLNEVMTGTPVALDARASVVDAAKLMRQHNIGDVLVTRNEKLLGIRSSTTGIGAMARPRL